MQAKRTLPDESERVAKNEKTAGALRSGLHLIEVVSVYNLGDSFLQMSAHRRSAAMHICFRCNVRVMVIGCKAQIYDALILRLYAGSAAHQFLDFIPVHALADKIGKLNDFGLAGLIAAGLIRPPASAWSLP